MAGCSTFDTSPFLREQITGDTWRACAAREYQAQARARAARDWSQATVWAAKGRAALIEPSREGGCDCGRASALKEMLAAQKVGSDIAALRTRADEAQAACTSPR